MLVQQHPYTRFCRAADGTFKVTVLDQRDARFPGTADVIRGAYRHYEILARWFTLRWLVLREGRLPEKSCADGVGDAMRIALSCSAWVPQD